jgi:5-keto-L-gluconate epimerase
MKISFLIYEAVPDFEDLVRRMELVKALGYAGIELTATHPLGYAIEEVAVVSKRLSLPVVSLLSGWSYTNERLCLSSPDATIRRQAVERLIEYVSYVSKVGSVLVVGLMQGLRGDESNEELANNRIVDSLRPVARAAQEQGVQVVLEPVNHLQVGFNNTAAEAAAIVSRVGSPALSYMLDTIHMNIEEHSVLDTIREHGPHVRHFHLCDTNGGPFGSGGLDFHAVLATLTESGYRHYISVKIYRKLGWEEAARSAAAFLKEYL